MENHWLKRVSSAILAGVMALHCIPMATFAADTDGLCPHHTQHTGGAVIPLPWRGMNALIRTRMNAISR